jgi:Spy/CpxP family protein refolding chaperone
MAFAADQHGYPGPMHVLELKKRLGLTPEQEARVRALMHAMFSESRPKSARLPDAEARLRALFAGGGADEAAVRAGPPCARTTAYPQAGPTYGTASSMGSST